jgi:ribosomal protein S18 acetylase RimI-like enzyme
MENLRIRQVETGDLDACHEIESIGYQGHGATRQRIERRIREYPRGFLVAESAGHVVGFINSGCFHLDDISKESLKDLDGHDPDGPNVVIFSVVVHPDHRKQGISRPLLESLISITRADEKAAILLACRSYHLRYYGKFGFRYRAPSVLSFGGHVWFEMVLDLRSSPAVTSPAVKD